MLATPARRSSKKTGHFRITPAPHQFYSTSKTSVPSWTMQKNRWVRSASEKFWMRLRAELYRVPCGRTFKPWDLSPNKSSKLQNSRTATRRAPRQKRVDPFSDRAVGVFLSRLLLQETPHIDHLLHCLVDFDHAHLQTLHACARNVLSPLFSEAPRAPQLPVQTPGQSTGQCESAMKCTSPAWRKIET